MKAYRINLENGNMGIVLAPSLASAHKYALAEEGRNNVRSVVDATDEDVSWFKAMQGQIHTAK